MGILGDDSARRTSRDLNALDRSGDTGALVDEPWERKSMENRSMIDGLSHPRNLAAAPGTSYSPDASSSQHLMSSSSVGVSSTESFRSCSTASPPSATGCTNAFGGKTTACHRGHQTGTCASLSGFGSDCPLSRWGSERWNADSRKRCQGRRGSRICKCAAGVTADVAAVCCCPFSLLHLLAIAFIKLPSAVLAKTLAKLKRKIVKRRRRGSVYDDEDDSVAGPSFPPSRCRSYEEGDVQWGPALALMEKRLWQDYFDSPDAGIWSGEEHLQRKATM